MKEVVVGVDIGGTNTVTGLVDNEGNVLAVDAVKTTDYPEIDDFVNILADKIGKLLSSDSSYQLKGVGIGAPNGNFHKGTIEQAPNLAWKGIIPLADMMKAKLNCDVVLTNDANAAAVGEMMFGAAQTMKDFIILTLGTGLGSGIVIDRRVVYGSTGFAGEMGHIKMIPGGRDCGCGGQGCLETYVSATGIVRTTRIFLNEMMNESSLRNIDDIDSKIIAEAAAEGDEIALEAFDYTAEMLAYAISNAIVFSSPEAIILFGGLAKAGDLLFKPLRKYTNEIVQPVFRNTYKIIPSGIPENNAAVIGAAALRWSTPEILL